MAGGPLSIRWPCESTSKNLFAHPLGPKGENAFEHDGGEIIFNLPNGLQAYLLVGSQGQRIDKGRPAIVSDPVQKDRAVVNGLSCMSCHVAGMIREHVQAEQAGHRAGHRTNGASWARGDGVQGNREQ